MNEDSLTHYGVLGMKWGRRKQKVSKGSNTKKSSKSKQSQKNTSNIKKKIKNITSKVDKEKVKSIAKTTAKIAGSLAAATIIGYTGTGFVVNTMRLNDQIAKEWDYVGKIGSLKSENKRLSEELQSKAFPDRSNITNEKLRLLPTTSNGKSNGVFNLMALKAISEARENGGDPEEIAKNWMSEYNRSNKTLSEIMGIKR